MQKRNRSRRNRQSENKTFQPSAAMASPGDFATSASSTGFSDKLIGLLALMTPCVSVLVGLSLLFLEICLAIEAKDRSWRIFVDAVEADWSYVQKTALTYATMGCLVGVIVEPLFWIYRQLRSGKSLAQPR